MQMFIFYTVSISIIQVLITQYIEIVPEYLVTLFITLKRCNLAWEAMKQNHYFMYGNVQKYYAHS